MFVVVSRKSYIRKSLIQSDGSKFGTGGQADRQTDRQTGTGRYRDAPHLKMLLISLQLYLLSKIVWRLGLLLGERDEDAQ